MRARDVVRRLEAYDAGAPLPASETIHLPIADDDDLLLLAFVRMGGESLPWGIATAYPGTDPNIWCVPEPRDRDQVAGMLAEFMPALGRHLQHPDLDPAGAAAGAAADLSFRQIWVPNPSHAGMLHLLNLRYTFARRGPEDRVPLLNTLGRTSGFLFRDAQYPGHLNLVDASAALRTAYVFPTDDIRAQHLGYLLALLTTEGGWPEREAAGRIAEGESVSITLDPALERDTLQSLLERYGAARDRGLKPAGRAAAKITRVIEGELRRRLELTQRAVDTLRADPRPLNPGTEEFVNASSEARLREFIRDEERLISGEKHWVISPETDRPIPAAASYFKLEEAHENFNAALLHHDRGLQDEAIALGDAFRGIIIDVRDEGEGRKTKPVWRIRAPGEGPLRLRERSRVCVAGLPGRQGVIRSIAGPDGGAREFTLEITGLPTRPRGPAGRNVPLANDDGLEGTEVTMLPGGGGGFSFRKMSRAWNKEVPGGWLTHSHGSIPSAGTDPTGDVVAELDALRAA